MGDGDEDDDSLLAATDINFTGSRDLEGPELSLEFGDVVLEVDECLGDFSLNGIGGSVRRIGGAENLVVDGHLDEGPSNRKVAG